MPGRLRIHGTSRGVGPSILRPGEDLVLELAEEHGLDAPAGVATDDYLDLAARRAVDGLACEVLSTWRRRFDDALTVENVCLPAVWELELLAGVLIPSLRALDGLRRALDDHRPDEVVFSNGDVATLSLVRAAAGERGVPLAVEQSPPVAQRAAPGRRRRSVRELRRRAIRAATAFGVPSALRAGSVVVLGYWHLMPLLDRMLAEPGWRPAVSLDAPPASPLRSLRTARRGGLVGRPGPQATRRARASLRGRELRALAEGLAFPALGPLAARFVHDRLADFAAARAPADLARVRMWRGAFADGRVAHIVVPNDVVPEARLAVTLAQETGIPVLAVQHGVYLPPSSESGIEPIDDRVGDLELTEEVAVWSPLTAEALRERRGPTHVVGYPMPHRLDPPKTLRRDAPHVVVLVQGPERVTALVDARMTTLHCATAVRAITSVLPNARITLRPHPAYSEAAMGVVAERFPDAVIETDRSTDILELLGTSDLCIGSKSTATFQAALTGVPVVGLNLTGAEWKWPLGGETPLPVARSQEELEACLERLIGEAPAEPPGRHELLYALGATGEDGSERLLELVRRSRKR